MIKTEEKINKEKSFDSRAMGLSLLIVGMFLNLISISPLPKILDNAYGTDTVIHFFLFPGCGMFFIGAMLLLFGHLLKRR
jgi:hypothetical protein